MRGYLFLPSLLLATVLCYLPTYGSSDREHASAVGVWGDGQVITISEAGLSPSILKIGVQDSMVSFVNSTTDSPVTLSLQAGDQSTSCNSVKPSFQGEEAATSDDSISPNGSVRACLPGAGSYAFTILGLKSAPEGVQGVILVE